MAKIHIAVIALYGDHIHFKSHTLPVNHHLLAKHKVIPLKIMTEFDETLIVHEITDIRRVASMKAGGLGERYTCLVTRKNESFQKEIFIYKDADEWYMEEHFWFTDD